MEVYARRANDKRTSNINFLFRFYFLSLFYYERKSDGAAVCKHLCDDRTAAHSHTLMECCSRSDTTAVEQCQCNMHKHKCTFQNALMSNLCCRRCL